MKTSLLFREVELTQKNPFYAIDVWFQNVHYYFLYLDAMLLLNLKSNFTKIVLSFPGSFTKKGKISGVQNR